MLKDALGSSLTKDEIAQLVSSFDVIGDIAIIKIPDELALRQELIADQILSKMKNIRTVLKQSSDVQGEFRIRDLEFVKGEERFETTYKESSCLFKVNLKLVYFSPRLATERERIASQVKTGEHIFNMFSGIGTFSIVIAKRKECRIESVDKNPAAYDLARESLRLNRKLRGEVSPILADAGVFALSHRGEFDRILMPLPERAAEFLPAAIESAKKGAIIHYYLHVPVESYDDGGWITRHLENLNLLRKVKVQKWKRVREVGPRYIQAVADIVIES